VDSPEKSDPLLPHGGYRKLRSYKVAEAVYDATVVFCRRFLAEDRRMTDQMVQAARSGVRSISQARPRKARLHTLLDQPSRVNCVKRTRKRASFQDCDLDLQASLARVVDNLLQLPGGFVVNPFLAALRTDCGADVADNNHPAPEVGAECGCAGGFLSATQGTKVIGAHNFFFVR
jgi:hypothetical protein